MDKLIIPFRKGMVLFLLVVSSVAAYAQQTVSGVVVDETGMARKMKGAGVGMV